MEVTSPPATEPVIQQPSFNTYTLNNYVLHIFKDAGYDLDITCYITDKGTYTIIDQSGNWGKLKSGDCWINFDDASSKGKVSYIGADYVSIESDPLNLRASISTDSAIVTTIPKKTSVTVIDYEDSWCYIEWNGYTGYASTQYFAF